MPTTEGGYGDILVAPRNGDDSSYLGGRPGEWNEDLANFVNEEYRRRREERRSFELQWRLNLEFLRGNQFVEINPGSHDLSQLERMYDWEEREPFNKIQPIHTVRTNRLSRVRTSMQARPATTDQSDVRTAKVSGEILRTAFRENEQDQALRSGVGWLEATGSVIAKSYWDPNAGRVLLEGEMPRLETPYSKEEDFEEPGERANREQSQNSEYAEVDRQQIEQYRDLFTDVDADNEVIEVREGDVANVYCSPFEIFPQSSTLQNISDNNSIIHARAYHVDHIREHWNVQVEPEEVEVITLQEGPAGGLGGLGYGFRTYTPTMRRLKQHAMVKEYWERPSKRYSKGRYIVVAGDRTVWAGPLPYVNGKQGRRDLPFDIAKDIEVPGQFWGACPIEHMIPLQRRYNALRNRKAEYLNMVAVGQWMVPYNSLVEDMNISNLPGLHIEYYPARGTPQPVQFPNLPSSFENEIEQLDTEFVFLSGVSEISLMSEAPAGVKAGISLSLALEQDDVRLSGVARRLEDMLASVGRKWIRMYRQFATNERIARTISEDGEIGIRHWRASELNSDDVVIEGGPGMFDTPAQRRQLVMDLMGNGMFNNPQTGQMDSSAREKVFELLDMGHWETGAEDDDKMQRDRARRENNSMIHGEPVWVEDFDDHFIHLQMHTRQRLGAEYEALRQTEAGEAVHELFAAHVQHHLALLYKEALTQASIQSGGEVPRDVNGMIPDAMGGQQGPGPGEREEGGALAAGGHQDMQSGAASDAWLPQRDRPNGRYRSGRKPEEDSE